MDLVHDRLSNRRPYKVLTVLDAYTREVLGQDRCRPDGAQDVLEALTPLILQRGAPDYLRSELTMRCATGSRNHLRRPRDHRGPGSSHRQQQH